jgi:hypothetical protein
MFTFIFCFAAFIVCFIILASLLHLSNTVLVGILTIFYKDDAKSIANAIAIALAWSLGICTILFTIWLLNSLFGAIATAIILLIVFVVWFFFASF